MDGSSRFGEEKVYISICWGGERKGRVVGWLGGWAMVTPKGGLDGEMVRKKRKQRKKEKRRSGQLMCSKEERRCCRRKEEVEWMRPRIYVQKGGRGRGGPPTMFFFFLPDHGLVEKNQGKEQMNEWTTKRVY